MEIVKVDAAVTGPATALCDVFLLRNPSYSAICTGWGNTGCRPITFCARIGPGEDGNRSRGCSKLLGL